VGTNEALHEESKRKALKTRFFDAEHIAAGNSTQIRT
jgi:hypothetical protein